jgi:antitoxin PrlF
MATNLTSKGQVTIPKRIRDALNLQPGMPVEFDVNAQGEVVIRPTPAKRGRKPALDRFEALRGSATIKYRSTAELMKLLRDPVI